MALKELSFDLVLSISLTSFSYIQIKIYNVSYILLSNYDHTTLQGQFQEEPDYTATPWLHETKRGQCKELYTKKQQGNENIDEQHTCKYDIKLC